MSTVFVPEVSEAATKTVIRTAATIVNLPPEGTRIRATLGGSALVGQLTHALISKDMFYIHLDSIPNAPSHYEGWRHFGIWLDAGWTFEILDTPTTAQSAREYHSQPPACHGHNATDCATPDARPTPGRQSHPRSCAQQPRHGHRRLNIPTMLLLIRDP